MSTLTNEAPSAFVTTDLAMENKVRQELFVASFAALFLEVMFIRWVPAYERMLAYFTNFVLISSFLGLGLGAILARKRRDWMPYQLPMVLGLAVIAILFRQYVKTYGAAGDINYSDFLRPSVVTLMLPECLALFFLLIAITFVPLGQKIGQDLAAIPASLEGYTINILGSIAGVLVFTITSFLNLAPWCWFLVASAMLLWLVRRSRAMFPVNVCAAVLTIALVWWAGQYNIWTPYNKLTVRPVGSSKDAGGKPIKPNEIPALINRPGFSIAVNDDFYQEPRNLSAAAVTAFPSLLDDRTHYDTPYQLGRSFDDVLVVGAGTGNDVAAALRHGAQHVDAVEIDPVIAKLGRVAHPEQPYSDPRVTLTVEDARAFFNNTKHKYDLIVFAMLDSKRLLSGMSSVRLDSFVYTAESFREARFLLKDHGLVSVQHSLGSEFLFQRLYWMLTTAFDAPPGVTGKTLPDLLAGPGLADFNPPPPTVKNMPKVEIATDDWPFFYMAGRFMPPEYRTSLEMILVIAISLVLVFSHSTPVPITGQLFHFFFLGAAFLLIETLSVTRFALLFGSTWTVNSVVFIAILLTVLLANLFARRAERMPTGILYLLLGIGVLINFFAPLHKILALPLAVRLALAVALMGAPIFWAALIFSRSFRDTLDVTTAFAANLLGAVVGGLVEYSALLIGFRHQLLIALAFYALSYVALRWNSRQSSLIASAA